MTTQHNTLPVQEVLITKARENFSPHFLAWVNRLGQFYFKVLDCKMRFHGPSPPPPPQKLKICSCKSYYVICVTMYCWNTEAINKKIAHIYCNAFCNLVLLWATKKPFPIEPRKPSINSRFIYMATTLICVLYHISFLSLAAINIFVHKIQISFGNSQHENLTKKLHLLYFFSFNQKITVY